MLTRFKRALSEEIVYTFLESTEESGGRDIFGVIGTRGNFYSVSVNYEMKSTCNCQDFKNRKSLCKHLILILIKHYTLNLNQIQQLTENEHFGLNDVRIHASLSGDACPICFQDCLTTDWTCGCCNNRIHNACISSWFEISQKQGINASCPMCRHPLVPF